MHVSKMFVGQRRVTASPHSWKKETMETKDRAKKNLVPPPALWTVSLLLLSDLKALLRVAISAITNPNSCVMLAANSEYLSSFSFCVVNKSEHNTGITYEPKHPLKLPDFQHRAPVPSKADISQWGCFPVPAAGKYRGKSLHCHIWTTGAEPELKIFLSYSGS